MTTLQEKIIDTSQIDERHIAIYAKPWIHAVCFLLILAILLPLFLHRGLFQPFTAVADADTIYVGQTLLFNAGMAQTYFDHTGYIYILILSGIFKLLHLFHLVPVISFKALQQNAQFGYEFSRLVYAGRIISLTLAIIFVYSFYLGMCAIGKKPLLAMVLSVLLAASVGVVVQSFIIRPELMSAYFGMLALFFFIIAFRSNGNKLYWYLILAGFCNLLSLEVKIQAIVSFSVIPFLALGYIYVLRQQQVQLESYPRYLKYFAIFALIPFFMIVISKVYFAIHWYQCVMVLLFLIWLWAIQFVLQLSRRQLEPVVLSVLLGTALGFYMYYIHYNENNVSILLNFVDHLKSYTGPSAHSTLFASLLMNVYHTIASKVNWEWLREYPLGFCALALLSTAGFLYLKKQKLSACYVLSVLLTCLLLEVIFHFRYYSAAYHIYIDFLYLFGVMFAVERVVAITGETIWFNTLGVAAILGLIFLGIQSNMAQMDAKYHGIYLNQPPTNFCDQTLYNPPLKKLLNSKTSCDSFITSAM